MHRFLVIFLVLTGFVYGGEQFEIIRSDQNSIILELKPIDISLRKIEVNGSVFDKIEPSPFYTLTTGAGLPELPVVTAMLGLPFNAQPAVNIVSALYEDLPEITLRPAADLEFVDNDAGGYLREIPAQTASEPGDAEFYPANVAEPGDIQIFRNRRIGRIDVCPMRYNAATRILRKYTKLVIEIVYGTPSNQTFEKSTVTDFDDDFDHLLLNAKTARSFTRPSSSKKESVQNDWYQPQYPYFKLSISEDGIYRVNADDLEQWGITPNAIDPRTLRLFLKGEEIPVNVSGADAGQLDYIEFWAERNYGESTFYDDYSDTSVYWLSYGGANGKRLDAKSGLSQTHPVETRFRKTLHFEEDADYYNGDESTDIIDTKQVPGEGWIWEMFYKNDVWTYDFTADHADAESAELCTLTVKIRGTTFDSVNPDHHAVFTLNDSIIGEALFDNREQLIYSMSFRSDLLNTGSNRFVIRSEDTGAEINAFYLDWFGLSYPVTTTCLTDVFDVRMQQNRGIGFDLWDFSSNDVSVFNVTQQYRLSEIGAEAQQRFIIGVTSAGFNDGNFSSVRINDQVVINGGHRGHNIAVFDTTAGEVVEKRSFDTLDKTENADSMAAFIQRIPNGQVVIATIRDEGSYQMTDAAYQALESLGSALTRQVQFRDSWALIGRKGAAIGTVPELLSRNGEGPVALADTLYTFHDDSWRIRWSDAVTAIDRIIVSVADSMKTPSRVQKDDYKNLTDENQSADYIIITHQKFEPVAAELADLRAQDGLRTVIVDVEDIYDEFNYGIKHPQAIKDFLSHCYFNWQKPAPQYVQIIGDASWDPKKNEATSVKQDYVPVYGNPVSDNWYVCFDGADDILPEMSIGRFAIETVEQGQAILSKIKNYQTAPSAEWKKQLLFINGGFDNAEQRNFGNQTNRMIRDYVEPPPAGCAAEVISKELDGLYEGEKREEIIAAFNSGKMWVNFIGHGGSGTWELMFHDQQILQLQNENYLPFVTSYTCHTGRFANPQLTNFGELFVNTPDIGAIGFMGTTGWGFVYTDERFARSVFETALRDTVHQLGKAIALAKVKLWGSFTHNIRTESVISQYSLLGDAALHLALPETPDLVLNQNAVSWQPFNPAEEDSSLMFEINVQNYGLATADSVRLRLTDYDQLGNSEHIFDGLIPPVRFKSARDVPWALLNKAGRHVIEAVIDPDNVIAEVEENNNRVAAQLIVNSQRITISRPGRNQVIRPEDVLLQINNPRNTSEQGQFIFELDTADRFDSGLRQQSPQLNQGVIVTNWQPVNLQQNQLYFWRCQKSGESDGGARISSMFRIGDQFGWAQTEPAQFPENNFNDTELTNQGARLRRQKIKFRVESAGFDDSNYALIFVYSEAVATATRGHNIAICDLSGEFLEFRKFDTHDSAADVAEMTTYLNSIPPDYYVLIGIRDSGHQQMTEEAYRALERIGSAHCRDVGFRDSWAIVGRKGAGIGTVPEQFTPRYQGVAIAEDSLITFITEGTVESEPIGPANRWNSLAGNMASTAPTSNIVVDVLGFHKRDKTWEQIQSDLSLSEPVALSHINANLYPKLKLRAKLTDAQGFDSPYLKNWRVSYDPVPDIAIADDVVTVSRDSVPEGSVISITAEVHNVGYVTADSIPIRFDFRDPAAGRKKIVTNVIDRLESGANKTTSFSWNTAGHPGLNQLYLEIDPDDSLNELSEANNLYSTQVQVDADTLRPDISLTFDGQEIVEGQFVSKQPQIIISVHDNNPAPIGQDTSKIHLVLNGSRIAYTQNTQRLEFLSTENVNDPTLKARLKFSPELTDGEYLLEVFVKDNSGNSAYQRRFFKVTAELKLLDVLNYPNPFQDDTYFTYFLTQPADFVVIKLYTVAGRLIRQIENVSGHSGFNKVYWNGLDQDYDRIANGVYFYKIIARLGNEQTEHIGKFVVMR